MNIINCISLNYQSATVDIREKLSFTLEEQKTFLRDNMVILSTCNRIEFYFQGYDISAIAKEVCAFKEMDYDLFKTCINIYSKDKAILHLYRVTAGMESKILGEDEILGQVKDAYYLAHDLVKLSYEIHTIFQGAITSAKKIKTETLISKSSVSIGTLVASFIAEQNAKKVMIIGVSGKIGTIVAKNILSYGEIELLATTRGHNCNYIEMSKVTYVPFTERYSYMKACDIVISATTSPHFTVTAGEVKKHGISNKIFIDLAVPRDIDEDIKENQIYNIDYFETISKNHAQIKLAEREKILGILEEQMDDLKKEMYFHTILPELPRLQKISPEKMIYKARDGLTAEEFQKFIEVLK